MYRFVSPLQEGVILKRRNRFVMDVLLGDTVFACHCPVTGRIGDVVFDGVPCLVSSTSDPRRNTAFTVEAISIDADRRWIGIHQGRVNDFIEYCLETNTLPVFPAPRYVEREKAIGGSRIDFKVDGFYMEVKSPLAELFVTPLPHFKRRVVTRPIETERLLRHLKTLVATLPETGRAVLLYVFLYDAPVFTGNRNRKQDAQIRQLIREAIANGLEIWQVNGDFSTQGIRLIRCFETTPHFK